MAYSLSLEHITSIATADAVVKAQVNACGLQSDYVMDSIVRRYMGGTLLDLYADIGDLGVSSVELEAGIGNLLLTKGGATFTPCSGVKTEIVHMADEATKNERLITCGKCSRYDGSRCKIAGCGCSGAGVPARLYSKCPMGYWPK